MLKLRLLGALVAAATLAPCLAHAHHPGGTGNNSGAGPANTIPATTLEEGHVAAFMVYEFIRLRGLDDQDLAAAAGRHQHVHGIGTIQSTSLGAAFGVTDDLTVSLRVPLILRTDIREGTHSHLPGGAALNGVTRRGDASGLGDMTVMGQWRFYNNGASGTEAALLFGVKLPTGATGARDRAGEVFEAEFQPGSGSVDPLIGIAATQRFGAWSLDANVVYVFVSSGTQQTNLGDRFQYNGAVSYRLIGSTAPLSIAGGPPAAYAHLGHTHTPAKDVAPSRAPAAEFALDGVIELNGEWHDRERVAGVKDRNSGGNTVYLSPGLRASYERFSGFVSVGVPVVNHMNGLQSKPSYRVVSGLAVSF
jgi:hypothetical protein